MQEVLLINPRKRRAKKRATSKRRSTRRANPVAHAPRKRRAKRRSNPVSVSYAKKRTMRRRSPVHARRSRRYKRNPISMRGVGSSIFRSIVPMVKEAFIGAVGSVAVDYLAGKTRGYLPAMLNTGYGYDATKAVATVALGVALRGVTKGYSVKMAQGALTVQADKLLRGMLPASVTTGLGYSTAGNNVPQSYRVGPNARALVPGISSIVNRRAPNQMSAVVPGRMVTLNGASRATNNASMLMPWTYEPSSDVPAQREGYYN